MNAFAQNDNLLSTVHKTLNLIRTFMDKLTHRKIVKHQYLKNKNDLIEQFHQFMRNRVGKGNKKKKKKNITIVLII